MVRYLSFVALTAFSTFGWGLEISSSSNLARTKPQPYTESLAAPTTVLTTSSDHRRSLHSENKKHHARLNDRSPFPKHHEHLHHRPRDNHNATSYRKFNQDALSSDRANATLRNSTGLDGPESGPNKNHVASLPFAKVTPQEQSSITPTPLPTSQPGSNTTQNTYFQPAFSHGANPSNPTSWKSQPTPNFAYTRNGGRRDMSQQHQFVNMNVGFHGNRTAVDLESTDGAQQIDCNETHWRIQTKDKAHFDVAMSWPHDVILVTGSFCETGETRRLIEVQELSFPEPSVIVANGKPGFLNNGLPVSTVSVEFGNHRPSDSSSALTPIATAPTQPAAQPDQPGPSTVYNKRGWFKSEWSKATSHIGSAASVATSHVESAASVVTSHVEAAASLHGSTSKSMHIQVPKATPTGTSPFSTTGNKLASFHGMDVWDLGMQVNGGIELGGGFTADLAHIGKKGWASAYMFMHGSDWNFDFPLGLEFQGTNEHYENTNLTIGEPIDLCAEFGCIAVQDIFEIGSFLQMNLNATIDVTTSGKINMGTKYSYAAPQVYWGTDSQNATGFEPSNREKWFNVSDGSIQVSGGLGLDFVQLNGLKITKVKEADFYVQIVDGVSVAATVTKEQKGSSKSRRDISAREHPKDVLARELAKRDTCPGLGVKLELDEALMLQADAGPFNGGATLFATQIPLYSTCISKSTSSAHSPNPTHSANSTHSTNSTHSANSTISSGSAHSALSTPFGFKNSTNSTRPTRNMRLFPSITPAL